MPYYQSLRRVATAATSLVAVAALVGCGFGSYAWASGDRTLGTILVGGSLFMLLFGVLFYCLVMLVHKFAATSFRTYDAILDTSEVLRRQSEYARTAAENSSLSDWAKRIVYREKDYEFLRDTIEGASVRQDWATAEHLIHEVEREFGFRDEAARLRQDLEKARAATQEEKVAAALARFEELCGEQKWERARSEVKRLRTLFPDEPRIASLPRELEARWQSYKRQLLRAYDDALKTDEVDRAHALVFELDGYLSPSEGAALKESARGVFKAKLQQMGVEFSLAVSDHKFNGAISVGERLIREFPNSRYAQEIAQMLPILRERAAQEAG